MKLLMSELDLPPAPSLKGRGYEFRHDQGLGERWNLGIKK